MSLPNTTGARAGTDPDGVPMQASSTNGETRTLKTNKLAQYEQYLNPVPAYQKARILATTSVSDEPMDYTQTYLALNALSVRVHKQNGKLRLFWTGAKKTYDLIIREDAFGSGIMAVSLALRNFMSAFGGPEVPNAFRLSDRIRAVKQIGRVLRIDSKALYAQYIHQFAEPEDIDSVRVAVDAYGPHLERNIKINDLPQHLARARQDNKRCVVYLPLDKEKREIVKAQLKDNLHTTQYRAHGRFQLINGARPPPVLFYGMCAGPESQALLMAVTAYLEKVSKLNFICPLNQGGSGDGEKWEDNKVASDACMYVLAKQDKTAWEKRSDGTVWFMALMVMGLTLLEDALELAFWALSVLKGETPLNMWERAGKTIDNICASLYGKLFYMEEIESGRWHTNLNARPHRPNLKRQWDNVVQICKARIHRMTDTTQ